MNLQDKVTLRTEGKGDIKVYIVYNMIKINHFNMMSFIHGQASK